MTDAAPTISMLFSVGGTSLMVTVLVAVLVTFPLVKLALTVTVWSAVTLLAVSTPLALIVAWVVLERLHVGVTVEVELSLHVAVAV